MGDRERLSTLETDRDTLLDPSAWLNDSLITTAQALMKQMVPSVGGLQPPCLGQLCAFKIERGKLVQILHDGHGHWLTISTIGATRDADVFVYDSLFNSVTRVVKQQVAAILFTEQNTIELKVMDVQMHSGSANCGLFAIAFAIALVCGVQPGSVVFDQ